MTVDLSHKWGQRGLLSIFSDVGKGKERDVYSTTADSRLKRYLAKRSVRREGKGDVGQSGSSD